MDGSRFDHWTRRLGASPESRRGALRLMLGAGAVLTGVVTGAGSGYQTAEAATCKKVDQPCRRARQCCSGLCRGKRGKKKCRGHGAGTCKRGQSFCTAPNFELVTCNNRSDCRCIVTTSGTSFCYNIDSSLGNGRNGDCANCQRDIDCVKLGLPRGSACVPVTAGRCAGMCPSGRACVVRCSTV